MILAIVLIYKSPLYLLPSLEPVDPLVQERTFKIDFQDCGYGGHPGLLIETIFAILIYKLIW